MATAFAAQAIIPVFSGTIHDQRSQLVDARSLHYFLEIGRDFTTWIKSRISKYGFVAEEDFSPVLGKTSNGRPATEYHITLDMAKELSMVERNEKGRQARRYFIECEKRLRQIAPSEAEDIQAKTIGTNGFQCLAAVLDGKVRNLPAPYRKRAKAHLWQQIHKAFSVCSAQDIPANQMDSARNFIGSYSLEGEYIPASKNDDHVTINLPKAPSDRFDNLPPSALFGMDVMYCSKLSEMLSLLSEAIRNDRYVRVIDISAVGIEVEALRHWLEHLVYCVDGMGINLGSIQVNAERLLEYWMTVFNPCVSKLNQVAAREFQERLHATVMAAASLRRERGKLISA